MAKSEQETIGAGLRVKMFLADDEVKDALDRLEKRYYEEFKGSKTAEDRAKSWAKSSVLDDFLREMRIVVDAGDTTQIVANRREAKLDFDRSRSKSSR